MYPPPRVIVASSESHTADSHVCNATACGGAAGAANVSPSQRDSGLGRLV